MTIEDLLDPTHSSKPRNKLIAQIFYDMGIIERYGSGIQRMIQACREAGLPDPVFEGKFGGFAITFAKDLFTEEFLSNLGLNKRQIEGILYVKVKKKISNKEYRERYNISRQTASRDLVELVQKKIFKFVGEGKRNLYYVLYESRMSQERVK